LTAHIAVNAPSGVAWRLDVAYRRQGAKELAARPIYLSSMPKFVDRYRRLIGA
jgi:hypothetical protein